MWHAAMHCENAVGEMEMKMAMAMASGPCIIWYKQLLRLFEHKNATLNINYSHRVSLLFEFRWESRGRGSR